MMEAVLLSLLWLLALVLVGLGWLAVLRVRVEDGLERVALGFWLGFVHVGWLVMGIAYVGLLTPAWVAVVMGPWMLVGLVGIHKQWQVERNALWCLVVLAAVAVVSFAGVLVPPTEGDSLAYHFALPKLYAESGGLVFAPVAVTFAGPQLTQMVSTAAYVLGGAIHQSETLMLAASWVGTLMMAVMVLALLRRFVALPLAAVAAVLVLGMPCVTYAFAAGTTELKQAGMMAALGVVWAMYVQERRIAFAVLVAALVGAQVASKMFMVFLLPVVVVAWGVHVVVQWWPWRDILLHGFVLAAVGVVVGAPWYISNWVMYGSPLFPALAVQLGSSWWSDAMQQVMQWAYLDNELMVGRDFLMLLGYPWVATFMGALVDSDRVGLGPFLPLLMMSGVGAVGALVLSVLLPAYAPASPPYGSRAELRRVGDLLSSLRSLSKSSELMLIVGIFGVVAVGYYGLWFWLGISGRSRHLLPVVPLLAVPAVLAVQWVWARVGLLGRGVLVSVVLSVVLVQVAMAVMLNTAAWQVVAGEQSREEFLRGQAAHYAAAELVNSLSPEELGGRVLVVELRNVLYFLQRPYFQNQLEYSVVVPVAFNDVAAVWRALRVGGFGAWVSEEVGPPREGALDGHGVLRELLARGCVVELARNTGVQRASRTMASLGEVRRVYVVYKLVPDVCPLEAVVAEAPVTRLYRGAIPMVEPRAVGIQERHE